VCDLRHCVFKPDRPRGPLNVDVVVAVDGAALAALYTERVLCPPPCSAWAAKASAATAAHEPLLAPAALALPGTAKAAAGEASGARTGAWRVGGHSRRRRLVLVAGLVALLATLGTRRKQ